MLGAPAGGRRRSRSGAQRAAVPAGSALGKALGVPADEAVKLFAVFNPGVTLSARIARVLAANSAEPSWELQMAREGARLMVEAGQQGAAPLAVLPSIAERADRFIARGHAHDDWTVIAKDALAR